MFCSVLLFSLMSGEQDENQNLVVNSVETSIEGGINRVFNKIIQPSPPASPHSHGNIALSHGYSLINPSDVVSYGAMEGSYLHDGHPSQSPGVSSGRKKRGESVDLSVKRAGSMRDDGSTSFSRDTTPRVTGLNHLESGHPHHTNNDEDTYVNIELRTVQPQSSSASAGR